MKITTTIYPVTLTLENREEAIDLYNGLTYIPDGQKNDTTKVLSKALFPIVDARDK